MKTLENARRRRQPDCLSDLMLDLHALGELSDSDRATTEVHLAACGACGDAAAALVRDRDDFVAAAPISALAANAIERAQTTSRRARRGLVWRYLFPLSVPAVAVALLLVVPRFQEDATRTRTKGSGFSLSPYVQHREDQPREKNIRRAMGLGERLHPGDKLQFHLNSRSDGYLTVVAVDAQAKVSVYYPPGSMAEKVRPGNEVPLQTAVELDDTLGRETVIALLCDRPIAVAEVTGVVKAAVESARSRGNAPDELSQLALPCAESRQSFIKVPRPGL